jgi:hypothetical protein
MRDLLLVLATALLLRAWEAGREGATPLRSAPPQLQTIGHADPPGEWRRRDMDGRPVLLFGEPEGRPLAAFSCERGDLLIERMTVRPSGGIETMKVTADNRIRTLPVLWDGASLPIGIASLHLDDRMVDSLTRSDGIELELGSEPRLTLPADPRIRALIEECRG